MYRTIALLTLGAGFTFGQRVDLSTLDKLRDKAEESANVDLDRDKLGFAASFLSSDKPEQKNAKEFLSGLVGVYVRAFEFNKTGAYTSADLDPVRKQLKGPGWSKIVDVKGKEETVEIYVHNPGKPDQGMLVIAAEEKELAIVNIVGAADITKIGMVNSLARIPGLDDKTGDKKKDE